jgi:hypothetical protein
MTSVKTALKYLVTSLTFTAILSGCSDDRDVTPFPLDEEMGVVADAGRDEGPDTPVTAPDVAPDLPAEDMPPDLGPGPRAQLKIIHALNHDQVVSGTLALNGAPLGVTLSHAHGTALLDVPAGEAVLSITSVDEPGVTLTFEPKMLVADQRYVAVMVGIRDGTVPDVHVGDRRDMSPQVFWIEGLKSEGNFPLSRDAHIIYAAPQFFPVFTSISGLDTTSWSQLGWGILRAGYEKISTAKLALTSWPNTPFQQSDGFLNATIPNGNGGRSVILVLDGMLVEDSDGLEDIFPGRWRMYTAEEGPGQVLEWGATMQVLRTAASSPRLSLEEDVVMDGLERYQVTRRRPVVSGQRLSLDISSGGQGQFATVDLEPNGDYVGLWTERGGQDQLIVVERPQRVENPAEYKLVVFNDAAQSGSLTVEVAGRTVDAPAKASSATEEGLRSVNNANTFLIRDPAVANDPGESIVVQPPQAAGVAFLVIVPSTRAGARWDILKVSASNVTRYPQ